MTCFEAGFVKYARECGLPDTQAAYIFKRAMEHPGAQDMFKDLDASPEQHSPDSLSTLGELLKHHLIHDDMDMATRKIQL